MAAVWQFGEMMEMQAVQQAFDWEILKEIPKNRVFDQNAPDIIFPSDNPFGVPLLDPEMQADYLIAPFAAWGTMSRKSQMSGTWNFYIEDYRFENLWKNPGQVIFTNCVAAVEPNFSIYTDMPGAVALWMVYRKRWISRWWQSRGIKIFVDLNVAHKHFELNWLGVPRGWKAYATRAYAERLNETEEEYRAAVEHAEGGQILFVVYGGGKKARELAERNAWIWYPDQETVKEARNG